jgi:hypothetical protein
MLAGGADSYNMLVPDVCSGKNAENILVSDQYRIHRGSMAFDRSTEFGVTIPATGQPCSQFALHDELDFIKELYDASQMLWVANSGVVNQNGMTKSNMYSKTKTQLFAHNAMVSYLHCHHDLVAEHTSLTFCLSFSLISARGNKES